LTATPPTVDEVVGAWIGFDGSGGEFVRIELRADQSGYLEMVAAPNFITHDHGVQIYKVNRWRLDGWRIACDLLPISSNAESAQATGELFVQALRINIHGDKRQRKIESTLHMESRVDQSNTETKDAIASAQRKMIRFQDPVGEKVRRERRWTSAGATPARELVRSTR
jgi:hypothetical protein